MSDRRSADEVLEELQKYKQEAEIELTKSWNEIERLENENEQYKFIIEDLTHRCNELENQLEGGSNGPPPSEREKNGGGGNNNKQTKTTTTTRSPTKFTSSSGGKRTRRGGRLSKFRSRLAAVGGSSDWVPDADSDDDTRSVGTFQDSLCEVLSRASKSQHALIEAMQNHGGGHGGNGSSRKNQNGSLDLSSLLPAFQLWMDSTTKGMAEETTAYNNEVALLRQLEILQADKNEQIRELEVKLQQREEAIEALEQALQIKEETTSFLREELESKK